MKVRSELKSKVAQMIRDEFEKLGVGCMLCDSDFRTVEGFWRRADVYRWQIYVDLFVQGRWKRDEVSSWHPLTECGRFGIELDELAFPGGWEAFAKQKKYKTVQVSGKLENE